LLVITLLACGAADKPSLAPMPAKTRTASGTSASPSAPTGRLSIAEARTYMLDLVNRDRKSAGLAPVELDNGSATAAGQSHAEDMAKHGYLGHWGSDGSVPEQRMTAAGGADMVLENASCFVDEQARTLDPNPTIEPRDIERAEAMFFNEVPPNDGHRRNILKPQHKGLGVGVAQTVATATEVPAPCFAQEFTDPYGTYAPLPAKMKVGGKLHVEGSIRAPAIPAGVGLARLDTPKAMPVAELNRRRSYPVPSPFQMYWPKGFVTPIQLAVQGDHFAIDVPVSDSGKPGLYEVSVWAKIPGNPDFVMVGLRTIVVD
jgi:uncharacterized protein YkwD